MTTKYIVDNLSGQTINGDLTINGIVSGNINISNNTLIIDGNESDFYKYVPLNQYITGTNRLPYSNITIKNIEGTNTININGYLLKNLTITNCTGLTSLSIEAPQLTSFNIPQGLTNLTFFGATGINNQRFGLPSAPDLTPSEDTLQSIRFNATQTQFTDVNYFQINNKANITILDLLSSLQLNNTLPVGLFNGLTGLNELVLSEMGLQDIDAGMFSFLESGNIGLFLNLASNQLTESSIDNIITDCLDRATNNGAINLFLALGDGTNATPSAQALLDINTLISTYGWSISYNP
jgi:hypothetical protein